MSITTKILWTFYRLMLSYGDTDSFVLNLKTNDLVSDLENLQKRL